MRYAALLAGCYRRDDAADPQVFLSAVVAVFSTYPESVVRSVCDPRGGMPSKSKFLPTVFELTEACEARMKPLREAERQRRLAEQNEADKPKPVDGAEAERRRAFIGKWREAQDIRDAAEMTAGVKLADLDARKLHGEHKAMVQAAIEEKLAALSEASKATPLRLSPLALKSLGLDPAKAGAA